MEGIQLGTVGEKQDLMISILLLHGLGDMSSGVMFSLLVKHIFNESIELPFSSLLGLEKLEVCIAN